MIELVDRDIEIIITTVFHMFKKLQQRLNMLRRDIENIREIQGKTFKG